jgi:hypothetical protein
MNELYVQMLGVVGAILVLGAVGLILAEKERRERERRERESAGRPSQNNPR